jgi:hypothetical protein
VKCVVCGREANDLANSVVYPPTDGYFVWFCQPTDENRSCYDRHLECKDTSRAGAAEVSDAIQK